MVKVETIEGGVCIVIVGLAPEWITRSIVTHELLDHVDGQQYTNLFGSHRAESGTAVVTTANVPDLIVPRDRMAAYFIYCAQHANSRALR